MNHQRPQKPKGSRSASPTSVFGLSLECRAVSSSMFEVRSKVWESGERHKEAKLRKDVMMEIELPNDRSWDVHLCLVPGRGMGLMHAGWRGVELRGLLHTNWQYS